MDDHQFRQYAETTQALVTQMNQSLLQINEAIRKVAEVGRSQVTLAAGAYDMSFLAIRTLAESHVDFRTLLLRFG